MYLQQRIQNRITLAVAVFAATVAVIAIVVSAYFILEAAGVEETATLEAATSELTEPPVSDATDSQTLSTSGYVQGANSEAY
jgi:hypothetical protein